MNDVVKTVLGTIFVIALFIGAFVLASYIQENDHLQEMLQSFGPLSILVVSFISGLNIFIPIPATAFIPIYSSAGFAHVTIIAIIVLGTTAADILSYFLGFVLRKHIPKQSKKIYKFVKKWCEGRKTLTQVIVFLYASFVPLPNELLLIPLGTLGVKLKSLFLAFTLGTTLHVTAITYGLSFFI